MTMPTIGLSWRSDLGMMCLSRFLMEDLFRQCPSHLSSFTNSPLPTLYNVECHRGQCSIKAHHRANNREFFPLSIQIFGATFSHYPIPYLYDSPLHLSGLLLSHSDNVAPPLHAPCCSPRDSHLSCNTHHLFLLTNSNPHPTRCSNRHNVGNRIHDNKIYNHRRSDE